MSTALFFLRSTFKAEKQEVIAPLTPHQSRAVILIKLTNKAQKLS